MEGPGRFFFGGFYGKAWDFENIRPLCQPERGRHDRAVLLHPGGHLFHLCQHGGKRAGGFEPGYPDLQLCQRHRAHDRHGGRHPVRHLPRPGGRRGIQPGFYPFGDTGPGLRHCFPAHWSVLRPALEPAVRRRRADFGYDRHLSADAFGFRPHVHPQ